ncbi:MAG: 30S ribosomal protein S8 [Patescibacteria group bacterium]|nr:30S ribosomal protein S8 [Patescibacteria group bacterium]
MSFIDFIIKIKNGAKALRRDVVLPYSNLNKEIGKVLVKENFLQDIKEETKDGKKILLAKIKYIKRSPAITNVAVISKPSLRVYVNSTNIEKTGKRGLNTAILSTSSGVMTGKEARKKGVGGELLFKIW